MSKLTTKNLPQGSGIPKTLEPGNHLCMINDITLQPGYKHEENGSLHLVLHLEGPDLGEEFEGLFLDKDDESQGRYYGQVARVKFKRFEFSDGEHNGRVFNRDAGILRALKDLGVEFGVEAQIDEIEADTIEEFVERAQPILCNQQFINFCIGGREYVNAEGYTNHDLFLVQGSRTGKAFENPDVEPDKSKLIKFKQSEHIIAKKETAAVGSFSGKKESTGGPAPTAGSSKRKASSDFDMD